MKSCYFALMTPEDTIVNIHKNALEPLLHQGMDAVYNGNGLRYPDAPLMESHNSELVFIILMFTLIGVAILTYNFNRRFKQSIQSFFQFYSLHQLTRDGNFITERVGITLYAIFLICLSLFTYEANFYLSDGLLFTDQGIRLFIKILVGYTLFFSVKSGINFIVGRIFETHEAAYLLVLDDFIISCVSGLILIPILFLTTYSPTPAIFYTGIIILVFTFIYRMIRAVAIGINVSQFSLFYLFLYLCSLEIVPILVIAKVLVDNSHL